MRLKTLNGAPLCEFLDFNEGNLLQTHECNEFQSPAWQVASEDTITVFKWRRLTSQNTRLRTGWSQPFLPGSGLQHNHSDLSFSIPNVHESLPFSGGNTNDIYTTITVNEQSSQIDGFLQHSLIIHDTLLSSQVLQDAGPDNTVSPSSFLTTSFGTTTSGLGSPSGIDEHTLIVEVPPTMVVTPLASLPSAHRLRSIYPQTPTPNLLCVLMTNPERREVFVRKGGHKMNLWEVTVADDTRSGFKVTFWIRPPQDSNNGQANANPLLLQTLERVKVGDILLLRNIALTSFRDTVYGQSLNPIITRARTSIVVLMRSSGVSVGQLSGLPATIIDTFMRVKKWARTHVAADGIHSRKRKESSTKGERYAKRTFSHSEHDETLPPDTMEAV